MHVNFITFSIQLNIFLFEALPLASRDSSTTILLFTGSPVQPAVDLAYSTTHACVRSLLTADPYTTPPPTISYHFHSIYAMFMLQPCSFSGFLSTRNRYLFSITAQIAHSTRRPLVWTDHIQQPPSPLRIPIVNDFAYPLPSCSFGSFYGPTLLLISFFVLVLFVLLLDSINTASCTPYLMLSIRLYQYLQCKFHLQVPSHCVQP
jgi:hypothetical protein